MLTTVQKWGNSLGVRIPKTVAQDAHIAVGMKVDIRNDKTRLVLTPVRRKRYDLASLLKQVTRDNLHEEVDFGKPVGREVW